jgi:hypothetical protein
MKVVLIYGLDAIHIYSQNNTAMLNSGHDRNSSRTPAKIMHDIHDHLLEALVIAKTPMMTTARVTMAPGSSSSLGTPAMTCSAG